MEVIYLNQEIRKKANKIREYLHQPNCKFAIWEVKEASKNLWPKLSENMVQKIEEEVTKIDFERLSDNNINDTELDELDENFWSPFSPLN